MENDALLLPVIVSQQTKDKEGHHSLPWFCPGQRAAQNYKRSPLGQLNPEELQRFTAVWGGGCTCWSGDAGSLFRSPNNNVNKLSEVHPISELLSDVALPLSASHPHISPPTGGRWQHVKRVSGVALMYSTLKLKMLGDFTSNNEAVAQAAILSSLS